MVGTIDFNNSEAVELVFAVLIPENFTSFTIRHHFFISRFKFGYLGHPIGFRNGNYYEAEHFVR